MRKTRVVFNEMFIKEGVSKAVDSYPVKLSYHVCHKDSQVEKGADRTRSTCYQRPHAPVMAWSWHWRINNSPSFPTVSHVTARAPWAPAVAIFLRLPLVAFQTQGSCRCTCGRLLATSRPRLTTLFLSSCSLSSTSLGTDVRQNAGDTTGSGVRAKTSERLVT